MDRIIIFAEYLVLDRFFCEQNLWLPLPLFNLVKVSLCLTKAVHWSFWNSCIFFPSYSYSLRTSLEEVFVVEMLWSVSITYSRLLCLLISHSCCISSRNTWFQKPAEAELEKLNVVKQEPFSLICGSHCWELCHIYHNMNICAFFHQLRNLVWEFYTSKTSRVRNFTILGNRLSIGAANMTYKGMVCTLTKTWIQMPDVLGCLSSKRWCWSIMLAWCFAERSDIVVCGPWKRAVGAVWTLTDQQWLCDCALGKPRLFQRGRWKWKQHDTDF